MHIMRRFGLVLVVAAATAVAGCSKSEPEPAKAPPAVPAKPAAVTPALRKALVEAVSMTPADAVAVVAIRSPRALVDGLNDFAGPEVAVVPGMALSLLPPGTFDMEGPAAVIILLEQGTPHAVFLMRIKEGVPLGGAPAEEGIVKIGDGGPEIFALKVGAWAAFSDLGSVKVFKQRQSGPRLAVDAAMAGRIGDSLVWVHVSAKPLTALAKPALQEMKQEAGQRQPAEAAAKRIKAVEWVESLLDQLDDLEISATWDGDRAVMRTGLRLTDNAPLLAIARAMRPIESYEGTLPETDRFLLAAWTRIDYAQAVPQVKSFLKPAMDLLFETMDSAAMQKKAGPGAKPDLSGAVRQAFEEQWNLADEYRDVLGDRFAVLMEIPDRGQGIYRLTETVDLKDAARYRVLVKKNVEATQKLFAAITGETAKERAAPGLSASVDYKTGAETIEGISVDVARFKFDIKAPPELPEEAERITKSIMNALYGPEGLVMRTAVYENRALATMGGQEVMARAVKRQRGQVSDLTRRDMIAAALKRVPEGSSMVGLVSLPACAAAADMVAEDVLLATLPEDRQEAIKQVPLPQIGRPALTEPTVVSVRVDGRTIHLDIDVPKSDLAGSIPYLRHVYANVLFYVMQHVPLFWGSESFMPRPPGRPASLDRPRA